jgi:malonyl-CoA O-methyltransferase
MKPLQDRPESPVPVQMLSTMDGYDRWAQIYDDEENPLVATEEPVVRSLLGEAGGLRVADIGCGTGRHAIALAAAGAEVTGLDFSQGMLARARAKAGLHGLDDNPRFVLQDIAGPLPLADATFDLVLCCLVLDHVQDLDTLLGQLRRITRPDGRLVISVMHPAMMLRGVQARFIDPVTGGETRPASCPHEIADYVMAITRTGLRITRMSEHRVSRSLAERLPRAAKYEGWPILLVFELRTI